MDAHSKTVAAQAVLADKMVEQSFVATPQHSSSRTNACLVIAPLIGRGVLSQPNQSTLAYSFTALSSMDAPPATQGMLEVESKCTTPQHSQSQPCVRLVKAQDSSTAQSSVSSQLLGAVPRVEEEFLYGLLVRVIQFSAVTSVGGRQGVGEKEGGWEREREHHSLRRFKLTP